MSDYDELTKTYKKAAKDADRDVIKDKYQDQVPTEEKDLLPHGAHADHYEDHGEDKEGNDATTKIDPEPKSEIDSMPHGSHADHYEEHGEGG